MFNETKHLYGLGSIVPSHQDMHDNDNSTVSLFNNIHLKEDDGDSLPALPTQNTNGYYHLDGSDEESVIPTRITRKTHRPSQAGTDNPTDVTSDIQSNETHPRAEDFAFPQTNMISAMK